MKAILTIIFILVAAWMLVKYLDNQPARPVQPVGVDLEEPRGPEPVLQSNDRRYYSPQEKAKNTEEVLMQGVDKKREQIEAAAQ